MARSQSPNSANSQFFICFAPCDFLDGQYTVWGQVVEGMEHVDRLKRGEPVSKSGPHRQDAGGRRHRPQDVRVRKQRLRFRPFPRNRCVGPGASARCGAAACRAGQAGPASSRTAALRDPAGPARARRRAGLQRHQGHPGAALTGERLRGEPRRGRGHAAQARRSPTRWPAFARPAKRLSRRPHPLRRGRARPACSATSTPRSRRRARAARSRCAFDFAGPDLDEAIAALGRCAAAALHRRPARAEDERDRRDYQTVYAARGRRGRRADRRAALHARAVRAASRRAASAGTSSRCMSAPAPSCRSRPTTRRAPHACRMGRVVAETADALNAVARRGRAHRRRRHHLAAPAGKRHGRGRHASRRSPARPRSSSRPATASGPSTC